MNTAAAAPMRTPGLAATGSSRPIRALSVADHPGHGDGFVHGASTYRPRVLPRFESAGARPTLCILRDKHPFAEDLRRAGVRTAFLDRAKWDPRATSDLLRPVRSLTEGMLPERLRRRVRPRLRRLYAALDNCKGHPRLLAWSVVLAAAVAAVRAVEITAPLAYFAIFVPITNFAALMPVALRGSGRSGAGARLFPQFGRDPAGARLRGVASHLYCRHGFGPAWRLVLRRVRTESGGRRGPLHAFVTGATGFIGRELVRTPVERGRHVRALVRDERRPAALPPRVERHIGNLTDEQTLNGAVSGVEVVFHGGAAIGGPWERHREVTVEGTRPLAAQAADPIVQTVMNMASLAAGRVEPPSGPGPLIRAISAELASGRALPAPAEEGRRVVEISRRIGPLPSAQDGWPRAAASEVHA